MNGLSLNSMMSRLSCDAKEKEEKRAQERKRNLMYLVADFLREQGYSESCDAFIKEARLSLDTQVCDNIDLDTILLEYNDYYYAKFNKYPKICKKGNFGVLNTIAIKKDRNCRTINKSHRKTDDDNSLISSTERNRTNYVDIEPNFCISSAGIFSTENEPKHNLNEKLEQSNEKFLKPLGNLYPVGSEWRDIANIITKEIVLNNLNVQWNDVKGLDECKNSLKEAAVYPLKYPHMFNETLTPWKGVLLYGPPGTGKTMLAKAVASECKATFFNITSSSLVSKWRGESEKYIRVLMELAKYYAPTIIFIDEVDWTVGGCTNDISNCKSEPSRRFRAELLAQLDGLLSTDHTNILLLAATNVPWELDIALLRRLEKRIYVNMPDMDARHQLFKIYLKRELLNESEYSTIIKNTHGYSGSDIKLLCKEAWMLQLRPIWSYLENDTVSVKDSVSDDRINNLFFVTEAMENVTPIGKNIHLKYEQWNQSLKKIPEPVNSMELNDEWDDN